MHSPQDVARAESTIPGDSAAPAPTNVSIAHTPLELDKPATVTLFTGDKVTLHPNGSVETQPGEGRNDIVFDEQKLGDEIHVIPSDAAKLLAEGKLDKRLFNITYLIREGYDDASRGDMPLIIEGESVAIRDVAKGRGTKVQHRSAKLKMSVVAQDKKKDKGGLWSRMASEEEAPAPLPEGVEKVWLDGMAHVALDESVPQIGAPEVWESGYTGEGVAVAVLDTGIDSTHPDLAGQVVAETSFVQDPLGGALHVDRLGYALAYRIVFGAAPVPIEGSSDPVVHVGRACVESEGDELETDPAGRTALIARGDCTFAEKYDAAVDAGATGVVFYNNEPGLILSGVGEAEHTGEVWATNISADHGQALINALPGGDVTLTFTDDYPGDLNGHGTHVASTIAGTGAASDGLRKGVAPNADLMNGRVCNALGSCQDSWIIAGMEWAAENGADIVNMSLGDVPTDGTDPLSQAVNTLTETHDVLFVIAAGNSGEFGFGTVTAPGVADGALTVGAVDKSDELAWFSSLGPRPGDSAVKPEITAPGVNIVAARAGGTSWASVDEKGNYAGANGTSMATPHVAGGAALLASAQPDFSAMDLKNALTSTAKDTGYLWYEQGAGRVDAARAVSQGVYAEASVNFGSFPSTEAPVERQITYSNHTDRVVNLRLTASVTDLEGNPAGVVTLSKKRITVHSGGTETITVTVDPQMLANPPGPHGGVVTAEADGLSVRTAIGFDVQREIVPLADDWGEKWTKTYQYGDPPLNVRLRGAALSPDGGQMFVYGAKVFGGDDSQLILTAINTTTGDEIWVSKHAVPYASAGPAPGIAVAPDGTAVFVTQRVFDEDHAQADIITIAYNNAPPTSVDDPALGAQLWQARHDAISPFANSRPGGVNRIAIAPDGQTVVVVGTQIEPREEDQCNGPLVSCGSSMLTIGYDTASGEKLWSARHAGSEGFTTGADVAINPDGTAAYVTGFEQISVDNVDVRPVTVAYSLEDASAGDEVWIARHDSATGNYGSWHNAVSEDGERVFVASTVQVDDAPFDERMSTHAYDAATGELLWSAQFGAADYGFAPGHTEPDRQWKGAITVSPNNDLMFVTGRHCEGGTCNGSYAMVTVAYDQVTGEERWSQIHAGVAPPTRASAGSPAARTSATSPDGSRLYVVGSCCWASNEGPDDGEQVTVTYDAVTGEQLATARHTYVDEPPVINEGEQVLVHPDGTAIYTVAQIRFTMPGWGIAAYVPPITVSAEAIRSLAQWSVDLEWTAPGADTVDIYRDDDLVATVSDVSTYIDELGRQRPGATFEYKVCASETENCSKPATVGLTVGRPSPIE